ncbi:hypothetical protein C8R44DRAFT_882673 [Mycena epipterygia]|nr:hypothetical protein C8R44DRAFT_882673 [Mycena epipterygia]
MPIAPGSKESYIGFSTSHRCVTERHSSLTTQRCRMFLEGILYGIYLSMFVGSCLLMWRKQKAQNVKNTYLLVTIFVMFLFITVRCFIDNVHNTGLDFGPPNTTSGVLANTSWGLATAVADAFVV